jgi:hypothetical protein
VCATGLAILGACAIAPLARAEVYKCAGDGGRPIYQEMPCPKGKELRNFQSDPPEITVLPGTAKADGAGAPAANPKPGKDSAAEKTAKPRAEKPRGDPAERRHLHSGMSEGDVLARVGPPDATTGQRSGKQMRWTWLPGEGDPETVTTVTFLNGIVATVERTLVKK